MPLSLLSESNFISFDLKSNASFFIHSHKYFIYSFSHYNLLYIVRLLRMRRTRVCQTFQRISFNFTKAYKISRAFYDDPERAHGTLNPGVTREYKYDFPWRQLSSRFRWIYDGLIDPLSENTSCMLLLMGVTSRVGVIKLSRSLYT